MNRRQKKKMDKKREKQINCVRGCRDYRGLRECKRFYDELCTQKARRLGYHGKIRWRTIIRTIIKAYTEKIKRR